MAVARLKLGPKKKDEEVLDEDSRRLLGVRGVAAPGLGVLGVSIGEEEELSVSTTRCFSHIVRMIADGVDGNEIVPRCGSSGRKAGSRANFFSKSTWSSTLTQFQSRDSNLSHRSIERSWRLKSFFVGLRNSGGYSESSGRRKTDRGCVMG